MSYQLRKARRQARREGPESLEAPAAPPPPRRLQLGGLGRILALMAAAAAGFVVLAGR